MLFLKEKKVVQTVRFNFKIALLLLLIGTLGCNNKNKENLSKSKNSIQHKLEVVGDSLLKSGKLNAVSIGILKDGKTYSKHFGELDKGNGNTPSDKTIYELGSVSKTFTGILVAQAVIDNKINLDDDIRKYLNGEFPNLEYNGLPIKIRHLLTHTTGFPSNFPKNLNVLLQDFGKNDSIPFKGTEELKKYDKKKFFALLSAVKMDTIPGNIFSYSNENAELMGYILEKIYTKSFNELLNEHIFSKAKMQNSSLLVRNKDLNNYANAYSNSAMHTVPHWVNKRWGASGKLKSTIKDLLHYLDYLSASNNKTIKKSFDSLFALSNNCNICYFWFEVNDEKMGKYYYHHGGVWGMQNYLIFFPEQDLGISILTNKSNNETGNSLWSAVNHLYNNLNKD